MHGGVPDAYRFRWLYPHFTTRIMMTMKWEAELERRVVEQTFDLLLAKERAEAILDHSFDSILVLESSGIVKSVNLAFKRMFGKKRCEGSDVFLLFEDPTPVRAALDAVLATRKNQVVEAVASREDGTVFPVDMVLISFQTDADVIDVICQMRDVTERRRAEVRQQSVTLGLRKVLALAYDLISIPDIDTLWKRAVEAARETLGLERCAIFIAQQGFLQGTYGTDREGRTTDEHDQHWMTNSDPWRDRGNLFTLDAPMWEVVHETQREWRDGEAVPVGKGWIVITPIRSAYGFVGVLVNDAAISGAPLDEIQQEIVAVFCSFLGNLYEHKRGEEDLRRALEREKELNELKSRFTSMISHEFRTPLTAIQLSTELLRLYNEKMTEEARVKHLDKIERQVWHLTGLLEDVLTFSRGEQVGLNLTPKTLDLRMFCESVTAEAANASPNREITFVAADHPDGWNAVIDPKLFRQALMNLLLNAVKYSNPETPIYLTLSREDRKAIIAVVDSGRGIPAADVPHIFDMFYRATNVETISGTGLGLALVRQIVETHRGTIACDSQEGVGTTFTVVLPRFT